MSWTTSSSYPIVAGVLERQFLLAGALGFAARFGSFVTPLLFFLSCSSFETDSHLRGPVLVLLVVDTKLLKQIGF